MQKKKMSQHEIDLREEVARYITPDMVNVQLRRDINVAGSEGSAEWDDQYGRTYGKNSADQQIIDDWLTELIASKAGYDIKVIAKLHDRSGKVTFWFRRLKPTPAVKIPKRKRR